VNRQQTGAAAAPAVADDAAAAAAELVALIEAGDAGAEARLVERYGRAVSLLLTRHTRGRPEAEDLWQETFQVALPKLRRGELRQPEKLPGFLSGIARSLAIEHYRKASRRKTDPDTDAVQEAAAAPSHQLGEILLQEKSRLVRQLLGELGTERDREILFRYYVAEEDKDAVAADFGLSPGQFNRVLHRARQRYKSLYLARYRTSLLSAGAILGLLVPLLLRKGEPHRLLAP
jgi:RNA polymerase sigma-70 factor, ECF subfamily